MPGIRLLFNAVVDLPTKTTNAISHIHINNTVQQDIIDLLFKPLNLINIGAILDMTNITQQTIIRKLEKADGSNYEEVKKWTWPDDNDDDTNEISGITIEGHNVDVKITMQSVIAEGSNKTVLGRKAIYTY